MRVYRPIPMDQQIEQMLDVVKQTRELLKRPPPDTFLGRETYKPFPKDDPESNIGYCNETPLPPSSTDG
ncbi:hypothetical protein [Bradyrhizobium sp. DOA1]|uniref:hypothetical protein n=1 Tax=Bradyrhizobium sp. DOA1 TaxID=1126616 RepID=UPI000AA0D800|nr:hypothetical protein [Bradyrhizobium sp. DOA1]